jgi:hypothetical protein
MGNPGIMKNKSATRESATATSGICRIVLARLLTGAALLGIVASADADQLQVTAANSNGDLLYDLVIGPSSTLPIVPVITNAITPINNAKDESTHGGFDALVWVSNSVCKTLDLIAADVTKGQIVRYSGASTLPTCYQPAKGAPAVNPTAQIIFKWSKLGSGPARPNGVSADADGNVFVVSSSGLWDPKPSVWVLPFNSTANQYCGAAAGAYCAPVLIDNKFSNTLTLALAETLVASAPAVTSTGTVLWNAGDLLVLVGDSFDARLIVYSSGKIYSSPGQLATHKLPLGGPTSTAIPWLKFLAQLAAPFGMDLWPANTSLGGDAGVLFTTIDGRILSFDTVQNRFVGDFAQRLGPGLQKIKVGTYANVPYAFVAQLAFNGAGQILAFAAPPANGLNRPLATVSHDVMNPVGLAVSNSGVQSVPTVKTGTPCAPPNPACTFDPLGPELVTIIQAYPGDNLSGTVQEQTCSVQSDPRVTIEEEGGWSCDQSALTIGAGTIYCPSFPSAVIPGSVCGHSGPTGYGFAVVEATATGIDPNDNNSFVTSASNIDVVMPGTSNLECSAFTSGGAIPLMAWGTRSDLTTVEGTIPEDSDAALFGPALGGQQGYLAEMTSSCDESTTNQRGISIYAIGLGLSSPTPAYANTLQSEKYEALQQTVSSALIVPTSVQNTLAGYIGTAEDYVAAGSINCALNEIVTADNYVRSNLPDFYSNLVSGSGNPNPAGDIDGRLANWYLTINTELAGNPPNATWPLPAGTAPTCAAAGQPQITSFFLQPPSAGDEAGYIDWTTVNTATASSCNLTDLYADAAYVSGVTQGYTSSGLPTGGPGQNFEGDSITVVYPAYPPSTGSPYGVDTYTLTCFGAAGTTPATQSMLVGVSTPTPGDPQLAISSFTAEVSELGDDGYLSWATNNETEGTTCTITDEYGGTPYNQKPLAGLPPNASGYFYGYFCGTALLGTQSLPAMPSDTLTLTCSDSSNGTAFTTLTITNPDGADYCD